MSYFLNRTMSAIESDNTYADTSDLIVAVLLGVVVIMMTVSIKPRKRMYARGVNISVIGNAGTNVTNKDDTNETNNSGVQTVTGVDEADLSDLTLNLMARLGNNGYNVSPLLHNYGKFDLGDMVAHDIEDLVLDPWHYIHYQRQLRIIPDSSSTSSPITSSTIVWWIHCWTTKSSPQSIDVHFTIPLLKISLRPDSISNNIKTKNLNSIQSILDGIVL